MPSPFVEDNGSGGWSGTGGGSGGGDKRSVQEGDDGYWQAATGSVTTATTLAVADAITQIIVQRKGPADLSLARISRMALFGLFIKGPLSFFFYQTVDLQFPGKRMQCVTWKLLLDQGPWSVFINMAFLFTLPVFEGRGIAAGRQNAAAPRSLALREFRQLFLELHTKSSMRFLKSLKCCIWPHNRTQLMVKLFAPRSFPWTQFVDTE
ncbi:hypothetical protein CYMTET_3813 [Cymbomonas tetramitiformis]|uniref:Uncharacterized protein n=1 Tax=Cymbomonas tetramitiformis TaxID=36881 RepID=A0AAE0LKP1_9CHLO|nr:hypothetical protein CYMTET_3813 [Cymbomonas tetramitiformis]